MSGVLPPSEVITSDNKGPILAVTVILLACFSASSALVRVYAITRQKLGFGIDDILYFGGVAAAVAQTITMKYAADSGLGRHMSTLSPQELTKCFKFVYASHILGLSVSTTFSKASVVALFKRLLPPQTNQLYFHALICLIATWALFSFFALAFECKLPEPWRFVPSNCPTKGKLYYPILVLNIFIDAVLAFYIFPNVWKLTMERKDRLTVLGLFGSRIIAVVHLSLITATLPRIHSFISNLQAGLLKSQITESEYKRTQPRQSIGSRISRNSRGPPPKTRQSVDAQNSIKLTLTSLYSRNARIYSSTQKSRRRSVALPAETTSNLTVSDGQCERQSSTASLRNNSTQ
ncbi:hypothetical protein AOQ84DRAFT_438161 [Glonium stellatum]|uniref:Rhodopsin domain-containing protein n=1 Tax=Glonium stellatum TaxID=574774 RepID=A0A8E2F530_9PEZI|nr:hypothetical protein AOQ84DRAFT_438161 [Glonium stellatum]